MKVRLCSLGIVFAAIATAQSPREARYRPVLDNAAVAVYDLDLPAGFHAPSLQNEHDVLWIGLNEAGITFRDSDHKEAEVHFRPGDVRFFRSFATEAVLNHGGGTFRGVLLELKSRATAADCRCGGEVERSVCGCGQGSPLPMLWAVALRNITVAGTTLSAGQSLLGTVPRGDTVLVAVTAVALRDDPGSEGDSAPPAVIQLQPGGAVWLAAGLHRLKNVGAADARFVTLEF